MLSLARRVLMNHKGKPPVARPARNRAPQFEALEDRTVPSTTWSVTPGNLSTVLASAGRGDTLQFAPGTYPQIVVTQNNLTLNGGPGVIVEPTTVTPVSLSGQNVGGAAIDIYGTNDVVNGFTVNGAADTDGNLWFGIRVIEGGSATIKNNTVENILNANTPNANIGIQIGMSASEFGVTSGGTAKVNNNAIEAYSGAGVVVDGSQANATVQGNTITGQGTGNDGIAEYGVQVSDGAAARIQGNSISGNTIYGSAGAPNNPATTSAGIFFFNESGRNVVAALNTITGNDDGVLVQSSNGTNSNGIQIVNNDIHENYGYAGVFVLSSNNVVVAANDISNNLAFNGVALNFSSNVLVNSNDVYDNGTSSSGTDGIFDFSGSNNQFFANSSYSNSGNGINLNFSTGDSVFNNITYSNLLSGIQDLGGVNDSIWLGASIVNSQNGIILNGTSGDTVVGNVLYENGQWGLYLEGAKNTFVANNLVVGNDAGSIYIDATSSGTVLINNLTSTPPVKDGTSGVNGSSNSLNNCFSDADAACSGLSN